MATIVSSQRPFDCVAMKKRRSFVRDRPKQVVVEPYIFKTIKTRRPNNLVIFVRNLYECK